MEQSREIPNCTYDLQTLPAWSKPIWPKDDRKPAIPSIPNTTMWSGEDDPPAIGEKVFIEMNRLGSGTVLAYFIEYGWLGLQVKLVREPKWHKENCKGDPRHAGKAFVFGVDLRLKKVKK